MAGEAEAPESVPDKEPDIAEMKAAAEEGIEADLTRGREAVKLGRVDLGLLFFMNALAIHSVATASESTPEQEARGAWLVKAIRECEHRLRKSKVACPVCRGSGRKQHRLQGLDGESVVKEIYGSACGRCGGTKEIDAVRSIEQLMVLLGQAKREYQRSQLAAGRRAVGEAWLPSALATALDVRMQARVCKAAALPCRNCLGFGRTDCRACSGEGSVACRAKGCDNGMIEVEPANSLTRTALTRREPCPQCHGTTRITCEACEGEGTVACTRCKGTGQRDVCSSCGGEGVEACRRCRGSGTRDGVACPECRGEGLSLCRACHGDGKRGQ